MARTFAMLGMDHVDLPDGGRADWRAELVARITAEAQSVQLDDRTGYFWINSALRWGEGIPHLTTVYVLQALKAVHARLPPAVAP